MLTRQTLSRTYRFWRCVSTALVSWHPPGIGAGRLGRVAHTIMTQCCSCFTLSETFCLIECVPTTVGGTRNGDCLADGHSEALGPVHARFQGTGEILVCIPCHTWSHGQLRHDIREGNQRLRFLWDFPRVPTNCLESQGRPPPTQGGYQGCWSLLGTCDLWVRS